MLMQMEFTFPLEVLPVRLFEISIFRLWRIFAERGDQPIHTIVIRPVSPEQLDRFQFFPRSRAIEIISRRTGIVSTEITFLRMNGERAIFFIKRHRPLEISKRLGRTRTIKTFEYLEEFDVSIF